MVKRRNIKPPFQVIENKEGFLPYSTGKRACPGAKLADMQLFLVLTNILAEYTLSLPKGDKGELGTQFKVKQRQQCNKQTLQPCHSGWHSCAEEPETVQSGRPGEGLTQFRFPLWLLPREKQQSIAPYLKVSHFPFYRYLNKILVLKHIWSGKWLWCRWKMGVHDFSYHMDEALVCGYHNKVIIVIPF